MVKNFMVRQGDVAIRSVSEKEFASQKVRKVPRDHGRVVLAYGEVTGHAHAIAGPGAELTETDEGRRFLSLVEDKSIVHEEHETINLPPGKYEVIQQSEYTPERIKPVRD